ncbi:hypothetical protein NA57DRAFT_52360 [Rhizodiscina lignyota]|uniref:Uncharacterized protein n=1 Tax=Rhizodiscina lignyota TaxID=1504668 RepID=A0A9P4M9H3_9PEZI|nr:hypothetical protein NA57DRAFT_52360 [Rhizodiscina lignyota]
MVFTAASRAANAANDPTYLLKLRIRGALTVLLLIPLGCLASVVAASSNFQSPAWKIDTRVWPCIPLVVISLLWNIINLAVLTKWKRPLNPLINVILHALLTILFVAIGAWATHSAASASSVAANNPYAPAPGSDPTQSNKPHQITADNGTTILVTPSNIKLCPAFTSCEAQETWMQTTQHRAIVALAGCAIFFLCLPIHILLTVLFIRDYQIRRRRAKDTNSDDLPLDASNGAQRNLKHPYTNLDDGDGTTSQVNLLRQGRGGLGFHKPFLGNDSGISVNTDRPQTAKTGQTAKSTTTTATTSKRPRWGRPKSNGPSLPLFSLSRSSSIASTIASRRSKNKTIQTNKDLPPVPQIDQKHRAPPTPKLTAFPPSPKSPKFPKEISVPPPVKIANNSQVTLAPSIKTPKSFEFPRLPQKNPAGAETPKVPENVPKISVDRPLSPVGDPLDRESFDYREPELTALPEESDRPGSPQTNRPTSPFSNLADIDRIRSLRASIFGADSLLPPRSSMASSGRISPSMFQRSHSPFGGSSAGRSSPWRERAERRALETELAREKAEREKELLEAQAKAHRAAEKMESAYLRDEMARLEEKETMRRKRLEDRVQKLKDTLEELKRIQDEEEERQKEREERERKEEEEFQEELRSIIGSGGNGQGPGVKAGVGHARVESYSSAGQGRVVEQHVKSKERPHKEGRGDGEFAAANEVKKGEVGEVGKETDRRRYSWEDGHG